MYYYTYADLLWVFEDWIEKSVWLFWDIVLHRKQAGVLCTLCIVEGNSASSLRNASTSWTSWRRRPPPSRPTETPGLSACGLCTGEDTPPWKRRYLPCTGKLREGLVLPAQVSREMFVSYLHRWTERLSCLTCTGKQGWSCLTCTGKQRWSCFTCTGNFRGGPLTSSCKRRSQALCSEQKGLQYFIDAGCD